MFKHSFAMSVLAVIGIAPLAQAQYTFFPNDATINYAINTTFTIVGYASRDMNGNYQTPSSPRVKIVSGSNLVSLLNTWNSSIVDIDAGLLNAGVFVRDSSTINMNSGAVNDSINALNSSIVNLSGGHIKFGLYAENSSTINIFGSNLSTTLVNNNYRNAYSQYALSGTLRDGTVLTNQNLNIRNGTTARFTLNNVPAPGSLVTALIGVVPGVLMRRRRRKSTQK